MTIVGSAMDTDIHVEEEAVITGETYDPPHQEEIGGMLGEWRENTRSENMLASDFLTIRNRTA